MCKQGEAHLLNITPAETTNQSHFSCHKMTQLHSEQAIIQCNRNYQQITIIYYFSIDQNKLTFGSHVGRLVMLSGPATAIRVTSQQPIRWARSCNHRTVESLLNVSSSAESCKKDQKR